MNESLTSPPAPSVAPHVRWGWLALILAITLLAHGRNVFHDFLEWDDQELVVQQPVLNPVTAESLVSVWTQPTASLYTPLSYTVWAGVTSIARVGNRDEHGGTLEPAPFHLLNILLHAGCATIVFFILRRLARNDPSAAIGAMVFAVHPLQVEPVAWVSGMNNLLAGAFVLGCVAAYLRSAESPTPRWAWYAVALALFVAGMFSKPTAIVTPVMLLAIDAIILRRAIGRTLLLLVPMMVLAAPFVIVGRAAQPASNVTAPPLLQRFVIAGDTIGFYTSKLAWPRPLLMDYARTPAWVLQTGGSLACWIALGLLFMIAAVTAKRWPFVAGSIAVFMGGFSIVLGLVPFGYQVRGGTVADRYVYLAMLGPAILVSMLLARTSSRTTISVGLTVVLLLASVAFVQSGVWRDTITLCSYTIDHNPRALAARSAIGAAYHLTGQEALAEQNYEAALAIDPADSIIHFNYGNLLLATRPADALIQYAAAGEAQNDPRLLDNKGQALFRLHRIGEAIEVYQSVLKSNPSDVPALVNLANCLATIGQFDAAEQAFRKVQRIDPDNPFAARGLQRLAAIRGK